MGQENISFSRCGRSPEGDLLLRSFGILLKSQKDLGIDGTLQLRGDSADAEAGAERILCELMAVIFGQVDPDPVQLLEFLYRGVGMLRDEVKEIVLGQRMDVDESGRPGSHFGDQSEFDQVIQRKLFLKCFVCFEFAHEAEAGVRLRPGNLFCPGCEGTAKHETHFLGVYKHRIAAGLFYFDQLALDQLQEFGLDCRGGVIAMGSEARGDHFIKFVKDHDDVRIGRVNLIQEGGDLVVPFPAIGGDV